MILCEHHQFSFKMSKNYNSMAYIIHIKLCLLQFIFSTTKTPPVGKVINVGSTSTPTSNTIHQNILALKTSSGSQKALVITPKQIFPQTTSPGIVGLPSVEEQQKMKQIHVALPNTLVVTCFHTARSFWHFKYVVQKPLSTIQIQFRLSLTVASVIRLFFKDGVVQLYSRNSLNYIALLPQRLCSVRVQYTCIEIN